MTKNDARKLTGDVSSIYLQQRISFIGVPVNIDSRNALNIEKTPVYLKQLKQTCMEMVS